MHCGVEQVVHLGDETHAPGTDAEDNVFPDDPQTDDEDVFDIGTFTPSFLHENSKVSAMPTIIRRHSATEKICPLSELRLMQPSHGL
mgnify:CR=1 FL=1